MLNPIQNAEAIHSATYVDNYIDSVENLPDDVSRILTQIRNIDVQYRMHLRDVDHFYDVWKSLQNSGVASAKKKQNAVNRMQQSLIRAQELGDDKMQIVNQLQDIIDVKTRQLDADQKNLDIREDLQQPHRLEQLQSQRDDYDGPTPPKQALTQSPTRGEQISVSNGSNAGNLGGTAHNSNVTGGMNANGNNNSALIGSDANRPVGKRSRRRNDNINNSGSGMMELVGNESNSTNEGGGSNGVGGNDRHVVQKNNSGASQKKNSAGAAGAQGGASGSGAGGNGGGAGNTANKRKKRKARGTQALVQANTREDSPTADAIDPDEPTYCVCNQISFGEMILCDNDLCPIEWFHFSCVGLFMKPKGRWFCPNCRGDRANVMKPKAQFLKELEKYNKEKEEKT